MKPFGLVEASTDRDALQALEEYGERGRILAGGQSLLLELKSREARPEVIIPVGRIDSLRGVSQKENGTLSIGPTTTYSELEYARLGSSAHHLLSEVAAGVADIPVRNVGTVGGAICQAGHRFDFPAVALALGGQLTLATSRKERSLGVEDFLVGSECTSRAPDELLVRVEFPKNEANTWAFEKFAFRQFDASLTSVVCTMELEGEEGLVRSAVVVVGAACGLPVRVRAVESALEGEQLDERAAKEAGRVAVGEVDPLGDGPFAPAGYKRELVETLVRRAVLQCRTRSEV